MTEGGEFAMWLAIGAGQIAFWSAMYPLLRAVARRIEARGAPAEVLARLEAVERQLTSSGEFAATPQRLAELEERLDFAERLLASARPAAGHEAVSAGPVA